MKPLAAFGLGLFTGLFFTTGALVVIVIIDGPTERMVCSWCE